jgi:hypothetical protein
MCIVEVSYYFYIKLKWSEFSNSWNCTIRRVNGSLCKLLFIYLYMECVCLETITCQLKHTDYFTQIFKWYIYLSFIEQSPDLIISQVTRTWSCHHPVLSNSRRPLKWWDKSTQTACNRANIRSKVSVFSYAFVPKSASVLPDYLDQHLL